MTPTYHWPWSRPLWQPDYAPQKVKLPGLKMAPTLTSDLDLDSYDSLTMHNNKNEATQSKKWPLHLPVIKTWALLESWTTSWIVQGEKSSVTSWSNTRFPLDSMTGKVMDRILSTPSGCDKHVRKRVIHKHTISLSLSLSLPHTHTYSTHCIHFTSREQTFKQTPLTGKTLLWDVT